MKYAKLCAALFTACAALPAAAAECTGLETLQLTNGRIHTMDASDSLVSTVLINVDSGKFVAVGPGADSAANECTRTIDLQGRTAVPGIIDNHNHIILLGLRPGHDTRLENARSIGEVLGTLAARAQEVPKGDWITSLGGFNINQFVPPPGAPRFPTRQEMDKVTRDNPVLLFQSFAGPSVTNSLGRQFFRGLGIAVAPDGGIASGADSLRALNALRRLQTFAEQKRGLGYAMTYAAEVGVTTHLDQGGFPAVGNDTDGLAHFDRYRAFDSARALYQEGKLINRIFINFLHLENELHTPELQARLLNVFNNYGDNLFKLHGIGEFTANGLGDGWKAGTRLVAQARWSNENHSLSGSDFRTIIDEWERVNAETKALGHPTGIEDLRWVVAHVPFITEDYIAKLANLGGGLSVLGGWRYISGSATGNGPPFRRILDHPSRIRVGMSSDGMQISPMNPWLGMYYAVTGKNARGLLINSGQLTTRKEALRMYTADNGWFLREEDNVGSIEAGKWADLIVLSADYFDPVQVSDEGIKDVYSVLTVVNGKIVHDNLAGTKRMYWQRDSRRQLGFN